MSGVDYVDDEPFVINSSGIQEPLSGALVYSGYSAMGGRGGYYYAPYIYGYLQRQNSGTIGTSYGKRFSFSPGTVIGTAASIIVAAILEANSLWEVALSVVVSLLGAVVDTVLYDWSVDFKKKTYKWSYRVRLNSNTGQIIYNKYRTKDFWLAYNVATGVAQYEYAAGFDEGFLSANTELIKAAIDTYLENNPQ